MSTLARLHADRPELVVGDVMSTGVATFAGVALVFFGAALLTGIVALGVQAGLAVLAATVCFVLAGAVTDEPGPPVSA